MNSKGFGQYALAVLVIVIVLALIFLTQNPAVKQTAIDLIGAGR